MAPRARYDPFPGHAPHSCGLRNRCGAPERRRESRQPVHKPGEQGEIRTTWVLWDEEKREIGSGGLGYQIKVFNNRGCRKERPDDGTPLRERVRLPESHGVVFQRVPEDLQDVAFGALDAAVDFVPLEAFGAANHSGQAAQDGFFKGCVLTWLDTNVGEFKDHGVGFGLG